MVTLMHKPKGKMGRFQLPHLGAVLTMPEIIWDSERTKKMHEKASRIALKEAMLHHWRHRWKDHFKASNRTRYQHGARSEFTKLKKMRDHHSRTDLVRKSRTKHSMTTVVPRFSIVRSKSAGKSSTSSKVQFGKTTAQGITGRLTMKFPFPTNPAKEIKIRSDGRPAITPTVMADELTRWSSEELRIVSYVWIQVYRREINQQLQTSPRWRKKYGGKFKSWGK